MAGRSLYLLGYNAALAGAWSYVLYVTLSTYAATGNLWDVWKAVEVPLEIAQTAAVAEVVHAAVGIVRSPVFVTGMQVASRLWILWGVVHLCPEAVTARQVAPIPTPWGPVGLSLVSLCTIWAISEILRYGHFAAKEAGIDAKPLVWLRYTGFIVLYPLGVSSELAMVYLAYGTIKRRGLLSLAMPNPANFAFDYSLVCILIVLVYVPVFPQLYGYMLKQRRKVLGAGAAPPAKKRQ